MTWALLQANSRRLPLRDGVIQCVVTSPPYWGMRDYKVEPTVWGGDPDCKHEFGERLPHGRRGKRGVSGTGGNLHPTLDDAGQGAGSGGAGRLCGRCSAWLGCLGLEPFPDCLAWTRPPFEVCGQCYVCHVVEIFREVRRVLRDDGTVWLNLGDTFAADNKWGGKSGGKNSASAKGGFSRSRKFTGLKDKDLVGIPWLTALALRSDGWWLRSDVIWWKPNVMPESMSDRPTRSHEYMFLLSKKGRYYYDAEAIKEPGSEDSHGGGTFGPHCYSSQSGRNDGGRGRGCSLALPAGERGRNKRTVWEIQTHPFPEAHFATFPPELVEPCVKAGSSPGDFVLDPFSGAGTVGVVCDKLDRKFVGVDLKMEYCLMARRRRTQRPTRRVSPEGGRVSQLLIPR